MGVIFITGKLFNKDLCKLGSCLWLQINTGQGPIYCCLFFLLFFCHSLYTSKNNLLNKYLFQIEGIVTNSCLNTLPSSNVNILQNIPVFLASGKVFWSLLLHFMLNTENLILNLVIFNFPGLIYSIFENSGILCNKKSILTKLLHPNTKL